MRIVIDLRTAHPTTAQQLELGQEFLALTYGALGVAPDIRFLDDGIPE